METLKNSFSFKDAENNKVECVIEITTRNKYFEFTMSGNYTNGGGQVFDQVKPATKAQKKLISLWKKHHLKEVDEAFRVVLLDTVAAIKEEQEQERNTQILCSDLNDQDSDNYRDRVSTEGNFTNVECACAIGIFFGLTIEELLNEVEEDDNRWTIQGMDYLIGDDSAMDEEWDKDLDNYIDECILPEVAEMHRKYFDRDAWKEDAKVDGRGHSLNRYDGSEDEQEFNGETFYIYRS